MIWDGRPAAGIQIGKNVPCGATAAGASVAVSVTFPQAYANPPVVSVSPVTSRLTPGYSTVSTTGFTVTLSNWSPAASGASTFDWSATPA